MKETNRMSNYFSSTNVTVFPAVNRSSQYVSNSRIISEKLLTGLVNNLVDRKRFVVDTDLDEHEISFNIDGYFFDVKYDGYGLPLYVKLNKTATTYDSLDGDNDGNFLGLEYVNGFTENEDRTGWFQLLDEEGNVPKDSWLKYDSTKIIGLVEKVDGGEVD